MTTFVSIAYYVVAVIMQFNKELFSDTKRLIAYTPCNVIAYALGFSILFLASETTSISILSKPISEYASLLTANVMLLGGVLILRKRFEISENKLAYEISL